MAYTTDRCMVYFRISDSIEDRDYHENPTPQLNATHSSNQGNQDRIRLWYDF